MTEENIRHNVEKHFGKVDFELIEFSKYNQPVTYKCLILNNFQFKDYP